MYFFTKSIILIAATFGVAFSFTIPEKPQFNKILANSCVKCPEIDPKKINVHLVHHSHDDVGWLKTVDQYYWGLRKDIANIGVQNIITSVVDALWEFPERKFIQVETAFFWKWWNHQTDEMQFRFKTLVDNGQIEIINGGWSMNDEGCVNYQSTIDQFTWGFKILNDTLGECGMPTFGWQIDPFGHSREHSAILYRLGFDGLVFSRLDYNDRNLRKDEGRLEFLWKTSANDDDSVIFGGITPDDIYYPPSGFCFDILCGDDNLVDDPKEETFNLDAKAKDFSDRMKNYAKWFKSGNVIVTMGGDFQYQDAGANFQNSDKLIKAFENNTEVKLHYSTPSCYLKAVYEAKPELETKTDDFFPYGSGEHGYWAGYFTSRPNYKRLERYGHNILQIAKQLNALAFAKDVDGKNVNVESIKELREAIGVAQHHDSITGTAKQHVSDDYTKILSKSISKAEEVFPNLIRKILNESALPEISSCILTNMSICATSQNSEKFIILVYNPLSWSVNQEVHLPVENGYSFLVKTAEEEVPHELLEPISEFSYVKMNNVQPAKKDLIFIASKVPALGFKIYSVEKSTDSNHNKKYAQKKSNSLKFGNDEIGFEIDESTNLLKSVTMNGKTLSIKQEFLYYVSSDGPDNTDLSGAYLFRPKDNSATSFGNPTITSLFTGEIVDEVHQKFNDFITQIIRVYKGVHNYIEFDWLVGPLDVSNNEGMEVISRFSVSDFNNNETFSTDSNGREMIERKNNYRPTYSYDSKIEPVASNYYPVTSKIVITDRTQNLQVSVLNERSQAGGALQNGEIELMVHRRILKDDRKGVGEALNEMEFDQGVIARGQHYLILGPSEETMDDGKSVTAQERIVAQQKLLLPWIGLADISSSSEDDINKLLKIQYSALNSTLPENVNLLTLEPWTDSQYLLRLEHIFEKNEDETLSQTATVNLENLFTEFTVKNVVEYTLGANRKLDTMKSKYDWTYKENYKTPQLSLKDSQVTLNPMDIKTFIVELASKN